jgi:hypothetical protein
MRLIMYYLYAKFHSIWANNNWAMLQFTIQKTYLPNYWRHNNVWLIHQQFIFCTFLRITSEPDEIE